MEQGCFEFGYALRVLSDVGAMFVTRGSYQIARLAQIPDRRPSPGATPGLTMREYLLPLGLGHFSPIIHFSWAAADHLKVELQLAAAADHLKVELQLRLAPFLNRFG